MCYRIGIRVVHAMPRVLDTGNIRVVSATAHEHTDVKGWTVARKRRLWTRRSVAAVRRNGRNGLRFTTCKIPLCVHCGTRCSPRGKDGRPWKLCWSWRRRELKRFGEETAELEKRSGPLVRRGTLAEAREGSGRGSCSPLLELSRFPGLFGASVSREVKEHHEPEDWCPDQLCPTPACKIALNPTTL